LLRKKPVKKKTEKINCGLAASLHVNKRSDNRTGREPKQGAETEENREPKQRAETEKGNREPKQRTKTENQNREPKQRTKTENRNREPKQRTKTATEISEPDSRNEVRINKRIPRKPQLEIINSSSHPALHVLRINKIN
jgi:hypothetical protein